MIDKLMDLRINELVLLLPLPHTQFAKLDTWLQGKTLLIQVETLLFVS